MLESENGAQNGVEHPESDGELDGHELAHRVTRAGLGAEASTSGRPAEPEGDVIMELDNVHKAFGSKKILQASCLLGNCSQSSQGSLMCLHCLTMIC